MGINSGVDQNIWTRQTVYKDGEQKHKKQTTDHRTTANNNHSKKNSKIFIKNYDKTLNEKSFIEQ